MKKNMGAVDKIMRLIVALLVVIAFFRDMVPSPWNYVLLAMAGIFVLTSLVSVCPLYSIFGIKTTPPKK